MMDDVQLEDSWYDQQRAQPRRLSLVEIADIQYVRMKAGVRLQRPVTERDLTASERAWLDDARCPRNNCDA